MIVPWLGFFTAVFPWPRRLHAYIVGACSVIVSGGVLWPAGYFFLRDRYVFRTCAWWLGRLVQTTITMYAPICPINDRPMGEVFSWPPHEFWTGFPLLRFPHPKTKASFLHAAWRDPVHGRFRTWAGVGECITAQSYIDHRLHRQCFFLKNTPLKTSISSLVIQRSAMVMAPTESPKFLHFNVDFVSHHSSIS